MRFNPTALQALALKLRWSGQTRSNVSSRSFFGRRKIGECLCELCRTSYCGRTATTKHLRAIKEILDEKHCPALE